MSVVLSAVQFNHNANSARNSALNIRRNAFQSVPLPEWRRGVQVEAEHSPAAYSIEDTAGQTITIRAGFARTDLRLASVEVRAIPAAAVSYPAWWPLYLVQLFLSTPPLYYPYSLLGLQAAYGEFVLDRLTAPTESVLGSVAPERVRFGADGQTGMRTFRLENVQIAEQGVGIHRVHWRWQYRAEPDDPWIDFAESRHRIYVVIRTPTAPWAQRPAQATSLQLPWTDVLDFACSWAFGATTVEEAAERITRSVNDLGPARLQYACLTGGISHYADPILPIFNCTAFVDLLRGGIGSGRYVNCTDCATIVSTFANALGCDLWQSRMGTLLPPDIVYFAVNPTVTIGTFGWSLPCGWAGFSYHEVAWENGCTADDAVYDACLQVNGAPDPLGPIRHRQLPARMRFGAVGEGQYRDRLAAPLGRAVCEPRPITRVRRSVF
jgi:hypothetical protein